MKIELIKKIDPSYESPWYSIEIDEVFVRGSYDLAKITQEYEDFKTKKKSSEKSQEILRCEEI